jgi:hypothetical protein
VAVITQHLHAPLIPPQAHNSDIPADLEALIVRLMSKDPDERPATAVKVRSALENIGSEEEEGSIREVSLLDRIVRGHIVAREQELSQAKALWQKTVVGQGQMLLISGEPGIGKSRMVREIQTEVEVSGGLAMVGECYAEGGIPYGPFAQVLQKTFQNGFSGDIDVPEFVMSDLVNIAPNLKLYYPNVPENPSLDPQAEQYRLFENLVTFCISLTNLSPTTLIFEDVHWADGGTLALLRHLARRTRDIPLMIVATYREVELDETLPFNEVLQDLNRERLTTRVKLTRLDQQATEQLLETLFAEDITPDFLNGIYRETEGNPFFIEEVCKALVDSGELYYDGGRWHRPSSIQDMRIPQSVRVAIQSRVNKLSDPCQSALLAAAILGREFGYETLQHTYSKGEDELIDALEEAMQAQLIEEIKGSRSERFAFAHALIPAVLREGISGLRRTRLHHQAAAAIKRTKPDDFEALAYQYSEAGDVAQALDNYIEAGERARKVYANEDAIRFLSEALPFLEDRDPKRFALLGSRASVFGLLGQREEQLNDVVEMRNLAEDLGEKVKLSESLLALADYHLEGEHTEAIAPAEEALELAKINDDPTLEAQALMRLGHANQRRFHLEESRDQLNRAAALFKKTGQPDQSAKSLALLTRTYGMRSEQELALNTAQEAVAESRRAKDRLTEASSLRGLAIVQYDQFDIEAARQTAENALALHRELGDRVQESYALNVLGLIVSHQGDAQGAADFFRQSLAIGHALNLSTIIQFVSNNMIIDFFLPFGDYEAALHFVEEQLMKTVYGGQPFLTAILLWQQAFLFTKVGQYDRAIEIWSQSRKQGETADARVIIVGTHLLSARNLARQGKIDEAIEVLGQIKDQLDETANADQLFPSWLIALAEISFLEGHEDSTSEALKNLNEAAERSEKGSALDEYADALTLLTQYYLHSFALSGERENLEKALEYSKEAVGIPERDIAASNIEKYCLVRYQALLANGDEDEALEYLNKAYERVMVVAGKTTDPELRRSWLEDVPTTREILAEAALRGTADPDG